jgi:hypothetical protein
MPIILNGANGIITSSGDITISDKIAHLDDTNTAIRFPAADTVTVETAGSERLRIDSAGNVGIGVTSPSARLHMFDSTAASSTESVGLIISRSGAFSGNKSSSILFDVGGGGGQAKIYTERLASFGANMIFAPADTSGNFPERMRIDSAGNLFLKSGSVFLGTTDFIAYPTQTTGGMNVFQMGSTFSRAPQNTSGRYWLYGSEGAAGASFILYNHNNTGVFIGYGGTSWTANSDERTKTPIVPFENAVDKICSLRAGTGRYLNDEEDVSRSFLIAQDVQAVLPEAVTTKEDEQGTLGLSYTDVIPLLVAAIKEQQATITSLTARITALESQ